MVTLMLMNSGEFQIYLKSAVESYAKEKVLSNNWNEEESISKAREEYEKLLPKGETTENNFLYSILNEGQTIGAVWLEQKNNENGFIRDIRISEKYQGLGYGKEAMNQIEMMGKNWV
ncbi:Acetyltransferase (GNAT) family protein [Virgibacillus subterraneus]|uniref:Acetyltransferase (GNAT) family protein n=1 Tax=Virgibacillus subterraneus TaxID=621109 RepID=A0A1H9GI00_9BACI|nr:Acetyltransferase (GNAT) family protein [Virgibacillus subterraneus]